MKYMTWILMASLWCCSCSESGDLDTNQAANTEPVVVQQSPGAAPLPEWAINANIYEVNIRQYTEQGTFAAFEPHLQRLHDMGVDILWFMPVYPISETKRKGPLGSYYAISDYTAVNPRFGTLEEFKALVKKAQEMGMYVILDWVPNHTGWDHHWIEEHPDWYVQRADTIAHPADDNGNLTDWTDVADLNYENTEMRKAMIEEMRWWIQEADIDGFRCDVAFFVPDDFWAEALPQLRAEKEALFILAESETPAHRNEGWFNMTYGWSLHHLMNEIAQGKKKVNELDAWLEADGEKFEHGFHMHFTSNHDENSWNGTVFERMGEGHKAMAVLSATWQGMPLVYSGQEEPLQHRLAFFDKDHIGFGDYEYADFYRTLLQLKKEEKALWNGPDGGTPERINESGQVYAFKREKGGSQVVVILNFSNQSAEAVLSEDFPGMREVFSGSTTDLEAGSPIALAPWAYKVYVKS